MMKTDNIGKYIIIGVVCTMIIIPVMDHFDDSWKYDEAATERREERAQYDMSAQLFLDEWNKEFDGESDD